MAIRMESDVGEATPETVGRYRVLEVLGRGGVAVVYRAVAPSGEVLALKQLCLPSKAMQHASSVERLFEREYHTLSQLEHPCIVHVGDFGRDAGGAYYTMELVSGGDLSELSPLPWVRACAVIGDICSAVSLLHSRRLVHRDLSTRNIRCTEDGKGKLIDFGAMVPVGKSSQLIGTPAFCAPEMVYGQSVDARTDLFALGASLYHALTGRHAYPARRFEELRACWAQPPVAPSRINPEVPEALNALVLSMLHLDPMARPANAAEVMERLQVIADLDPAEHQLVPQSYLTTPTLVGRSSSLAMAREALERSMRGRGRTLLIEGEAGVGRSRCLDACALEGKLRGVTVVRLRGDGVEEQWAVARDLVEQLVAALPPDRLDNGRLPGTALEQLVPGLSQRLGLATEAAPPPPSDAREAHAAMQAALCDWLLRIARRYPLVITVDDWEGVDEASAAMLATLANKAPRRRLLLIASLLSGNDARHGTAFKVLSERALRVRLEPLTESDSLHMLQSMFGDARHLGLVSHRLYAASKGHPRGLTRLAQHLVDTGQVRYEAGTWQLPARLDPASLPGSPKEALALRAQQLSPKALEGARLLALHGRPSIDFAECVGLLAPDDAGEAARVLDQLVAAEMLDGEQGRYRWSEQAWRAVLLEECPVDVLRALRLRLADHFQEQHWGALRAAHHRLLAGDTDGALDGLLAMLDEVGRVRHVDGMDVTAFHAAAPKDWIAQVKTLIQAAERTGRPKLDAFRLRSHLLLISVVARTECRDDFFIVIGQLAEASGLRAYNELSRDTPEGERLGKAFEIAQKRYDALAEAERILPPSAAIRQLALVIAQAIGAAGHANDAAFFDALPSLAPFVPLSPAIEILHRNMQATAAIAKGRSDLARDGFAWIRERLQQPDRGGLEGSYYDYVRLATTQALASIALHYGRGASALELAEELEESPVFRVLAWRTRMLHALNLGDVERAEQCKRRVELLQLQGSPEQFFEGAHLWTEAQSYALAEDLTRLKQILPDLANMADAFPGWRAMLHYAEANYHRIRGDHDRARASCEALLRIATPDENMAWRAAEALHVQVLTHAALHDEAVLHGRRYLERLEELGLAAHLQVPLREALAVAELRAGNTKRAASLSDGVLAVLRETGSEGLVVGVAHETRARIAIAMADSRTFIEHAQRCAEIYRSGRNPALTAKYEALIAEAEEGGFDITTGVARAAIMGEVTRARRTVSDVDTLTETGSLSDRADRAVALLMEQTGAGAGGLYLLDESRPRLASNVSMHGDFRRLELYVEEFLDQHMENVDGVTATAGTDMSTRTAPVWTSSDGQQYSLYLLFHPRDGEIVITGVAVLREPNSDCVSKLSDLLVRVSQSFDRAAETQISPRRAKPAPARR